MRSKIRNKIVKLKYVPCEKQSMRVYYNETEYYTLQYYNYFCKWCLEKPRNNRNVFIDKEMRVSIYA